MTDEQKILKAFIDSESNIMKGYDYKGSQRWSRFVSLLYDARITSGRTNKGELGGHIMLYNNHEWIDDDENYRCLSKTSFVGVSLYLFLLDMIGIVFRDNTKNNSYNPRENAIKIALKEFDCGYHLELKDYNTIISLRNCLAHNYGLIAIPKNHHPIHNWNHKFTLNNEKKVSEPLIGYPNDEWNGKYDERHLFESTKVNRNALAQLVENMVVNINDKLEKGEIKLALGGGIEELKARFTTLI